MFHIKCKLCAGHSNCLLRSREQDTEVPPRTAFWFLASADIRRHPKGPTITQGRGAAFRQQAHGVGSSVSPWSLGVRAVHSSLSIYFFSRDLGSSTHQSRGLFKGAVTERSMCVNGSHVVRALPQKWRA